MNELNELVYLVRERKNQLLNDNDGTQVELGSCSLAYLQQRKKFSFYHCNEN